MKSRLRLLTAVLADAGMACRASTERDFLTIKSRCEHEGLSFLTITLPDFASGFERGLEDGFWRPELFQGFRRKKGSSLPAFLWGLTSLVFADDGALRPDASVDAVDAVRQVCLLFKKEEIPCAKRRLTAAIKAYKRAEADISKFRVKRDIPPKLGSVFRILFSRALLGCFSDLDSSTPRHGPGSTTDRTIGNNKYRKLRWSRVLERSFPHDQWLAVNANEVMDKEYQEKFSWEEKTPVRVVFVPKTLKAPRVIAMEPVHMQYVQQAVMACLVRRLENDPFLKGHINFTDQSINRRLALESSFTRANATIDMSEASDRVHAALVHHLLNGSPMRDPLFNCRSRSAQLPTGEILHLKKFASMGSATCFPVEAMVFMAIATLSILETSRAKVTFDSVRTAAKQCYVYGDDIVIPIEGVERFLTLTSQLHMKVNLGKTFIQGHFRESCGQDAYNGSDVTPVRVKRPFPQNRNEVESVVHHCSLRNSFYKKGYWITARHLQENLERVLGVVPHVKDNAHCIGWHSFRNAYSFSKWDSNLHRFVVRSYTTEPKRKRDPLDGWRRLLKFVLEFSSEDSRYEPEYSSGRCDLRLKRRWCLPH